MKPFWIWLQEADTDDSYGEFYTSFDWSAGEAELRISADSDYTLFLTGSLSIPISTRTSRGARSMTA